MLTVEESQENFSSPSTVSSYHGSPNSQLQTKNSNQNELNIDFIFAKSLLNILSINKKSPYYYEKIKSNKDFHFTVLMQPGLSLLNYLRRILHFLKLDFSTLIIAMIYIDRICKEKVFLNEFNIHRIMIIAIYIAYSYNEDKTYDNNYLSLVSGMSKNEILTLEEDFLELIEFKLFVNDEVYHQYKEYIFKEFFNSKD
jgi:hypothetical protein